MRRTGRPTSSWNPAEEIPQQPRCDHPDCTEAGLYPAPKGRDKLREYFWFCLEHVRSYNSTWNYYQGMGEREIEAHIREDTGWQRPTWPLGRWGAGRRPQGRLFDEDLASFYGERRAEQRQKRAERGGDKRQPDSAEKKALAILELKAPVSWEQIKQRYKALAKRLHPDANGGDKAAEEQLKVVNQAYSTLKNRPVS